MQYYNIDWISNAVRLHKGFSFNTLLLLSIIHPSLNKITEEEEEYIHKGYELMPLFIHE